MCFKTFTFLVALVAAICMAAVQSDLMVSCETPKTFGFLVINCKLLFWHNKIETVRKQKIPIEKHTVITPDGYILGLYHIPARKNKSIDVTKVMFMMHGLFSSSAQYVLYPKDSAGE